MGLRIHQLECIKKINEHFENNIENSENTENNHNKKGLIKMFCGSGKSFIIYHCLLEYGYNLSVVVVPSINLITQFNQDYLLNPEKKTYNTDNFNKEFELLSVCSKNELDKIYSKLLTFTTDKEKIEDFLDKEEDKIILITYQSLKTLIDIVKEKEIHIDLICFDEAHHIISKNMKNLLFGTYNEINDEYNEDDFDYIDEDEDNDDDNEEFYENFIDNPDYVSKTLFFTATPKNTKEIEMFEPRNDFDIENQENDLDEDDLEDENNLEDDLDDNYCIEEDLEEDFDEDLEENFDEETEKLIKLHNCGKMIFEYSHIKGVNDNILNDFRIKVDIYKKENDTENQINIFEAICRTILETGNNRVLTFHSRSKIHNGKNSDVDTFTSKENIKNFTKSFNKIVKTEFPHLKDKYKNITFKGIKADTKGKPKILKDFDETNDDEIYVLASCKTIGEGIDTKKANMICFIDPKQSYTEIIQNIGRVCRKHSKNQNLATILIPISIDFEKYKDCKNIEEKDKVIRDEMSKTGDFNGILNVLSALRQEDPYVFDLCLNYPNVFTNQELKDHFKKNELELDETEYTKDAIFKENKLKYNIDKTEEENFVNLSNKINKNIIITHKKINDEFDNHINDIIIDTQKEETQYFVKTENDTNDTYMKVKGSIKSNEKIEKLQRNIKPFTHTSNEIKVLWEIESNIDIDIDKKIFGGYIKSTTLINNEENWIEMLENVKQYMDVEKKRPSKESKNLEIKKMGRWIGTQLYTYYKKIKIMKNIKIIKIWKQFIKNYKQYFLTMEEEWDISFNKLKNFIDLNNKLPSRNNEKKLFGWLNSQKNKYKNKIMCMTNESIYNKWTVFINNEIYKEYFKNNFEIWIIKYNLLINYLNKFNKIPTTCGNEKKLGYWTARQIKNYNNKKNIMKNEEIYIMWKQLINKYEKYFFDRYEKWDNYFEILKIYITENKKLPKQNGSCCENEKKIGKWLSHQLGNFKNKRDIMNNEYYYKKWETFVNENSNLFNDNVNIWINNLNKIKKYIDKYKKTPVITDKKSNENAKLGLWISTQIQKSKKRIDIMKKDYIYNIWQEFIQEYKEYFMENEEIWKNNLQLVKNYFNKNNKRPSSSDNNTQIKKLGCWLINQKVNYKKKHKIMKEPEICKMWEDFLLEYKKYFTTDEDLESETSENQEIIQEDPNDEQKEEEVIIKKVKKPSKKSTTLTIKKKSKEEIEKEEKEGQIKLLKSRYQELSRKMTVQKSNTTKEMFKEKSELWFEYHEARDFSFEGYDNKDEIPVNKIINYLKTKEKCKLKILDLGCGRNIIHEHFKDNKKFEITGYDYVSFKNSKEADISNLPEEDESIKICIYSQSLMGSNWKKYLNEGKRVLEYNGEMIIAESFTRYQIIKEYLKKIEMHIFKDDDNEKITEYLSQNQQNIDENIKNHIEINRWFYIHAIKNTF